MGFFRKRDQPTKAQKPEGPLAVHPDTVDTSELLRVARLLNEAIGSESHMRAAVSKLRRVAGMADNNNPSATLAAYDADPHGFSTRAFRWLAAGAQKAVAQGEPQAALLAYGWVFNWTSNVEPTLKGADLITLGL